MSALGDNVTMSLSAGEARSLIAFTRSMPRDGMHSLSLTSGRTPALTTGVVGGQDVVRPTAGVLTWGPVRGYLAAHLPGPAARAALTTAP